MAEVYDDEWPAVQDYSHVPASDRFVREMLADDWLSVAEAVRVMGVSTRRLRQLIADGRFPGARKPGRDWILPALAVAEYRARPGGRPRKPTT